MAYRDDEDIICSEAFGRQLEAENKKMKEVNWQNTSNVAYYKDENGEMQRHEEVCMNCANCSAHMHPYSQLRTSFGDPHGATFFLCNDIDMRKCKKHGFRTWERCWCPDYVKGTPRDEEVEEDVAKTEKEKQSSLYVILTCGFLLFGLLYLIATIIFH